MTENIQTFQAPSMREALAVVRREMGPDAVILGTRSVVPRGIGKWMGHAHVEITAGPPDAALGRARARAATIAGADDPSPQTTAGLSDAAWRCYTRLIAKSVSREIARRLARKAVQSDATTGTRSGKGDDVNALRARLKRFVAAMIPACGGITLGANETHRIALVGPAGAGKTTTLAKLAAHFKLKHHKSVAILSLDTLRLGARQQLECYTRIIDVPFRYASTCADVRAARDAFAEVQVVLIDTPGLGARDAAHSARVRELLAAADADEVHLVLPSSMAPATQQKVAGVFAPFGATRVVLTKLDDSVGFGVILNALDHLQLELSYITVGQRVPQDIIPACSDGIAELVLK